MLILGIETSCDETGVAIYDSEKGLLADKLYSQVSHSEFGGVVPELASRDHIRKCLPLINAALQDANCKKEQIDGIAYTQGPGLIGALLVGAMTAKSLGLALSKPVLGIHHMEGHLLAPMLEDIKPDFPFISLLVSGGHTMLVKVEAVGRYKLLGESLDDAAGEAFDKTAKILGLGYPGGPKLAEAAIAGNADRFKFPRPMLDRPGLDFSFSGLKTYALNTAVANNLDDQTIADISYAFQEAVVDTLIAKCKRALKATKLDRLVIAGGVSANQALREKLSILAQKDKFNVYYPRLEFCTDNGAMIAYVGSIRMRAGQQDDNLAVNIKTRWNLEELSPLN